ncbi:MAG: cytochrome c maturation protein CcmE [Methanomassiliicoccales archaeon]|nr:MAG: cytochrome c maturation protein CcmE [Methanomassiliicoccales archaeon]
MSESDETIEENADDKGNEIDSSSESLDEPKSKKKRKGLSSKRNKVLIVVAIISVALIIVLWGAAPGDYLTMEEVVENSDSYIGKEVEVIGKVGNWTGGQNFTLVGRDNESVEMFVVHEKALPDGFEEGKDVVVKGKLENVDGVLTFRSNHPIQVGCPSKY